MGDLSTLFKDAVASEVQQQQSTDWKRILAQSLAAGASSTSAGLAERQSGDVASILASSLLGGLGQGYSAGRDKVISEDVNSKFLSGIDQYESGAVPSLAKALQGLGLESAASGVGAFDTQRRLERLQAEQDLKLKNQLELDQFNAMTPLDLQRFRQKSDIEFQNQSALQRMRDSSAEKRYNLQFGGGIGQESAPASDADLLKPVVPFSSVLGEKLQDKIKARAIELQKATGNKTSSLPTARQEYKPQLDQLTVMSKDLQAKSDRLAELRDLTLRQQGYIEEAGETGSLAFGMGAGTRQAWLDAPLFGDSTRFEAMQGMEQEKPSILKNNYIRGLMGLNETEAKAIFGSGVLPTNKPEVNKRQLEKQLKGIAYGENRIKLEEMALSEGRIFNVEKVWQEYKKENPFAVRNKQGKLEVNDNIEPMEAFLEKKEAKIQLDNLKALRDQLKMQQSMEIE